MHLGTAADWLLVTSLAWPHLLYAGVWLHPHVWKRIFHRRAVWAFSQAALIGKISQFVAAITWFVASSQHPVSLDIANFPILHWLAFFVLVAVGQVLNVAIYKAIGVDGVYYGTKLGAKVPWCTDFPFNVVAHPQYVGSVLTVLGFTVLVWSQAPPGFGLVALYWSSLYAVTAVQENFL